MIESDEVLRQKREAARVHSYRLRPFDFTRCVTWPDTLKIYRELQAAQVMHDEAMKEK
jgi:hypothetical protein